MKTYLLIVVLLCACDGSTKRVAFAGSVGSVAENGGVSAVSDASGRDEELVGGIVGAEDRRVGDVRDVTRLYSWVSTGKVFRVLDRAQRRHITAALIGQKPQRLTGDIVATSEFVSSQFRGRVPGADQRADVARFVKDVMVGPYQMIATEDFCARQRRVIDSWLKGRETNPAAFMSVCSGVRGDEGGGKWTVRFNLFNTAGGVDAVVVTGEVRPFSVERFETKALKPTGEFSYPLEG
jgi:hypothetical protein